RRRARRRSTHPARCPDGRRAAGAGRRRRAGQTGLLSRPVGLVLTAAAAVLALVVAVVRSRACVEIHRDVLRYRVLWQLREVPVSEVGFPEQRRRTIDDLLVVRVAGRRPIRLSSTPWEPDAMEQLARELTLRGSAARRA